jgi:hypothetical protein
MEFGNVANCTEDTFYNNQWYLEYDCLHISQYGRVGTSKKESHIKIFNLIHVTKQVIE